MKKTSVVDDNIHLFPYAKVRFGEEIVLYGFGKVGHNYYDQIIANGYCNIKYIVDQNWEKYRSEGYPVKSPDCLKDESDSRVVLALSKKTSQITELLALYGIDDNRVIHDDTFIGNPIYLDRTQTIETITMSRGEAEAFYGTQTYARLRKVRCLLKLGGVDNRGYVRIGSPNDGGYVMVDDLEERDEKIAYSYGINNDVSWDSDMGDRGYDIYMYDHTIDCLPKERECFHFFRKGIADMPDYGEQLDTLESHIRENGHQEKKHMILKMDVEGAEWGFLNMVRQKTLEQFDQIILELHYMLDSSRINAIYTALEKLTKSHRLAHIHANNYGSVLFIDGMAYPDMLEITMVKRDIYRECPYAEVLPSMYDSPCWREYPEISLGKWNK